MESCEVNVQAVIQARSGATRLPDKTLELIGERPLLGWVIEALRQVSGIGRILVATTTARGDDAIENFAREQGVSVFRGHEDDVLGRFAGALARYPARYIARITADNPLLHPKTLAAMITTCVESDADHTGAPGGPIGATAEVMSVSALMIAHKEASEKPYREHVTPFIYTQPDRFKCVNHTLPPFLQGRGHIRITIDTPQDLLLIQKLYDRCVTTNRPFDLESVLEIIDEEPALLDINAKIDQKGWRE